MAAPRDDRGREVGLAGGEPRRIVSLVPSITETLVHWGLRDRLAGITRFCVHPEDELRGLRRVGGTKDPDLEAIVALAPDLVVVNEEENRREDVERLEREVPCWVTFPRSVAEVAESMARLAAALGCGDRARALAERIDAGLRSSAGRPVASAVYLIWREPYMSVSGDTYIHDVLSSLGVRNLVAERTPRYFELSTGEIAALDPDWVILPSEPFPFQERHVRELSAETGIREERIRLVPGEEYCWFGSRTATVFETHRRIFG